MFFNLIPYFDAVAEPFIFTGALIIIFLWYLNLRFKVKSPNVSRKKTGEIKSSMNEWVCTSENNNSQNTLERIPWRFWIGVMVFMSTFTNYMLRANMSVSIIAMVRRANNTQKIPPCLRGTPQANKTTTSKADKSADKYQWSETSQGLILSAYFWGYIITSIPGGLLSERFGSFNTLFYSNILASILTGLTPLSAKLGPECVLAIRLVIGMLGGLGYPAINSLIAHWAPPLEKGKFLSALMGNTLGTVVCWVVVGVVTDFFGWDWGFYVLVIIMVAYCALLFLIVADSPEKHRWISEEEKNYIFESQGGHLSSKKSVAPFKGILTSCRFWALVAAQFSNLWCLNLILTFAPKFMSETMGFKIKESTSLAASPYLARLIASQIFGILGDWMRKKPVLSVTNIRRFFPIFSHLLAALMLFLIPILGCNAYGIVALLVLNQTFNGAVVVGHLSNPQDLAPNYAGSIYGTMNFIASTTGFIIPQISAAFMNAYNSELEGAVWVFVIGGIVTALGGVIFMIFVSAEVQTWNEPKDAQQTT